MDTKKCHNSLSFLNIVNNIKYVKNVYNIAIIYANNV